MIPVQWSTIAFDLQAASKLFVNTLYSFWHASTFDKQLSSTSRARLFKASTHSAVKASWHVPLALSLPKVTSSMSSVKKTAHAPTSVRFLSGGVPK